MSSKCALELIVSKKTDIRLLSRMQHHYSKPLGFVGRSICYAIHYGGDYFGHIIGGSATLHLPGRNDFLGIQKGQLNNVVNNVFYNIAPPNKTVKYPFRNFTSYVVKRFRESITTDWYLKYGDTVLGFETLVEKPRTGELYLKDGWEIVGETVGFSCKRGPGRGTDSWGGKRVWDKSQLKPKIVLCRRVV